MKAGPQEQLGAAFYVVGFELQFNVACPAYGTILIGKVGALGRHSCTMLGAKQASVRCRCSIQACSEVAAVQDCCEQTGGFVRPGSWL